MTSEWRPIVFLHLPKTAGSSLRTAFYHQFGRDRVLRVNRADPLETVREIRSLPTRERYAVAAIVGHMSYGIHEALGVPCTYVTMLRDPVERVLSLFAYLSRSPDSRLGWTLPEGMSLEAFVDDWEMAPLVHNEQTRLLAGPLAAELPAATDESLVQAKRNLVEGIVCTGITERFDESLSVLQQVLGWDTATYQRRKVAPGGRRNVAASPQVLERIAVRNHLDLDLYALARERLDDQVGRMSTPGRQLAAPVRSWSARLRSASRLARARASAAALSARARRGGAS